MGSDVPFCVEYQVGLKKIKTLVGVSRHFLVSSGLALSSLRGFLSSRPYGTGSVVSALWSLCCPDILLLVAKKSSASIRLPPAPNIIRREALVRHAVIL